jgi:hypothetical protein
MGFIAEEEPADKRYDVYIGIAVGLFLVWSCLKDCRAVRDFVSS